MEFAVDKPLVDPLFCDLASKKRIGLVQFLDRVSYTLPYGAGASSKRRFLKKNLY